MKNLQWANRVASTSLLEDCWQEALYHRKVNIHIKDLLISPLILKHNSQQLGHSGGNPTLPKLRRKYKTTYNRLLFKQHDATKAGWWWTWYSHMWTWGHPLTPNHMLLIKGHLPATWSVRATRPSSHISLGKRWVHEYLPLLQERQKWNLYKVRNSPAPWICYFHFDFFIDWFIDPLERNCCLDSC